MRKILHPEERLATLRATDKERKWNSLDDKRICAVCDRVFTGRQIDFYPQPGGKYELKCPTDDCPSTINHWFLCELSSVLARGREERRAAENFSFLSTDRLDSNPSLNQSDAVRWSRRPM